MSPGGTQSGLAGEMTGTMAALLMAASPMSLALTTPLRTFVERLRKLTATTRRRDEELSPVPQDAAKSFPWQGKDVWRKAAASVQVDGALGFRDCGAERPLRAPAPTPLPTTQLSALAPTPLPDPRDETILWGVPIWSVVLAGCIALVLCLVAVRKLCYR